MTSRDIAIVSGCTQLRYASYLGHQLYARRHGLGYHMELAPFDGVRGYWHKVASLKAHLSKHDWVVWFDDDAFITDLESAFLEETIATAEKEDKWLVISPSCSDELNGAWAAYNTGVFALRNGREAHALLRVMTDAPMAKIQSWWDADRLGMFTEGDQDALVWFMETGGHQDSIHWADPLRWNARPWHYRGGVEDPPVCHFPGQPDKTLAITEFANRMGTDGSLLKGSEPRGSRGGLHNQVPLATPWGARLRRASLGGQHLARRVQLKIAWLRDTRRWS